MYQKLRTRKTLIQLATIGALAALAALTTSCTTRRVTQSWNQEPHTVVIRRDEWGVPHISAANDYELYYGYGYALAEDRLYQLEILKRTTQGKVAELLGPEYIDSDRMQRALFWPADIAAQLDALGEAERAVFNGMAAGINTRIADVLADPDAYLPFEFSHIDEQPSSWSAYDVVMLFVGSMLLRFGDFNTERENAAFLAALTRQHGADAAMRIFDAVNPRDHGLAPTTIPAQDWTQNTDHRAAQLPHHPPGAPGGETPAYRPRGHEYSNALVLGPKHLDGARAVLVNGPQFGWYVPAFTYSAGFHMPHWRAVGTAPLGFPLPMFGHTADIAWGSTWGASDNVDVFAERLDPTDPERYFHDGQWKRFETRQEIIKVKGAESVRFTARQSVHGPVIAVSESGDYAYTRARGWAGRELATLRAWIDACRARNHEEWLEAVKRSAINVNWYYADKEGHIAYFAGGRYPRRAPGHDNRLPASGDGSMDWRGFHPQSSNPQVYDPSSGYIANWNNKPGKGFPNPDEWWYSWSEADRVRILDEAVARDSPMTPDTAWDVVIGASYSDPAAVYFQPLMLAALGSETEPRLRMIAAALSGWDGRFTETEGAFGVSSGVRYVDPAVAIFRIWLRHMLREVLSDDLPGPIGELIAATTGYGTPDKPMTSGLNMSVGVKLLYEVLRGRVAHDFLGGRTAHAVWRTALASAIAELEERFGPEVSEWKLETPPTRFGTGNFLGIPQTFAVNGRSDVREMNRGTENNMTVFDARGVVRGYEVVPPGQSGHIGPGGRKSEHYWDQFGLYASHGRRATRLEGDVSAAATVREKVLVVGAR